MASLTQWTWIWETPRDSEGQGSLVCCNSWSHKELTRLGTWTINNNNSHYGKQNERSSKIKNRTTIWSSNFISGNKSKENETTNSERYLQPHVHSNIIYNSQDKETTYSTDNEWIKKLWYIYTTEYYSAIKKEKNPTICNNMDGPWRHYAKWNVRQRQILYITYMWNLKTNKFFKAHKTHRKRNQICGFQGQRVGEEEIGGRWSKGTNFQL